MQSPYVPYNNEIGVRISFLLADTMRKSSESLEVINYKTLEKKYERNDSLRLRKGLGAGNEVLLRFEKLDLIKEGLKNEFVKTFGNPKSAHNELEKYFEVDSSARLHFDGITKADGSHLTPEQISQWTINVSVLKAFAKLKQARETMHKRMGNSSRGLWPGLIADLTAFNEILKLKYNEIVHSLPLSERRLRPDLKGLATEGYDYFVHGGIGSQNAAKVAEPRQKAILETLLRKHTNYDNVQITKYYNEVAVVAGWKTIDDSTVANYKKQWGFFTHGGKYGETSFDNTVGMQNKRIAPSVATAYWTMDGWDVELLFQQKNEKGVTTYHNRLTVVVVIDRVAGLNYPIGFAIGTHETPALITEALRNAANHTRELFGQRHKPVQLQSDRYAIKALSPIYEEMSKHYTPARAKNAKAKGIERYFLSLNKMCQEYFPNNWSGFGVKTDSKMQPNTEYLNKIRHSMPDEAGVRAQITRLMEMERSNKMAEYLDRFEAMPVEDRLTLGDAEYLNLFGLTHTHTNKLQGQGLVPTIEGQGFVFDSFESKFREYAYMDWAVKYDPEDMSKVLVLNAESDQNKKVKSIIGTHRFLLSQKFVQPEALYDRKDGDAAELAKVTQFNKQLKAEIMERANANQQLVDGVMLELPQLNDTLSKMILTDSLGQHKDQKSKERIGASTKRIESVSTSLSMTEEDEEFEVVQNFRNNY